MAPVAPLGRDRAIALVRKGQLPILFGSPHPHMAIVEQDGMVRIRALVIDRAEADAAAEQARARGGPWMPEQYYALGKPTGTIHLEAKTAKELAEQMTTFNWPLDW